MTRIVQGVPVDGRGSNGGGVAIWHVDESIDNNDDETHKHVDLEEANETDGRGSRAGSQG